MIWFATNLSFNPDMLGYIPSFFNEDDPRSASEQINHNYIGGWRPQKGFTMDPTTKVLQYGDPKEEDADPPLEVLAVSYLRNEIIALYRYSYLAIIQEDGTFEVCRLD